MSRGQQVELYRRRLRSIWNATPASRRDEGAHWYRKARGVLSRLARAHRLPLRPVCAVVAAISPGCRWSVNVEYAARLLDAAFRQAPTPTVPTYNQFWARRAQDLVDLAYRMKAVGLRGGHAWWERMIAPVVSGPKRTAFYKLLSSGGDDVSVCVDGHLAAACWTPAGDERPTSREDTFHSRASGVKEVTPYQYELIAEAVRAEAKDLGIQPHQFQAAIWLEWRTR